MIGTINMSNEIYNNSKYFESRGSIYTIYRAEDFPIDFKQDKISKSYQGVIRGFHADKYISKLVTCLHGKVRFISCSLIRVRKILIGIK